MLGCTALLAATFLFAAYQACLQGAVLPSVFGASRTVFIPKSTEVDAQGLVIRFA